MNDEQLFRLFRSLQTRDLPDPAFADALFAHLESEVAPQRVEPRSRQLWVLAAAALLLAALLALALAVGSGLVKLPVISMDSDPMSPRASATATVTPGASADLLTAAYEARGQEIVDLWAGSTGGAPSLVVLSDGTMPGDGWPPTNNPEAKAAFVSGNVVAATPLSTVAPSPGEVRWDDGSSATLPLISAAQALDNLRAAGDTSCGCAPLVVDEATLASMTVTTTRGEATVPAWSFHLQGSDASLLHMAVDAEERPLGGTTTVPADPILVAVEGVTGGAGSASLTVQFAGAGAPGDQPCGADYAAVAFEADQAVVIFVFVTREFGPPPGADGCMWMDYQRTAAVTLGSPLGDRTVLDGLRGQPVPVGSG